MSSTPAAPGRRERSYTTVWSVFQSYIFTNVNKLTPDPSPTQARDSEPMVLTLKVNWNGRIKEKWTFLEKQSVILAKRFLASTVGHLALHASHVNFY